MARTGRRRHASPAPAPFALFAPYPSKGLRTRLHGFTLIEMLIVMALIALLLTLALPRYFTGLDTAREAVLRENLRTSREAIDKFYGDQGRFPDSLDELVARRYLRSLPLDPVAGGTRGWVLVAPEAPFKGQVSDLRSSAPGSAHDGTAFNTW